MSPRINVNKIGTTLHRFAWRAFDQTDGARFRQILYDIALASKIISRDVNRSGLTDVRGALGVQNIQGEEQQKLDIIAHVRFMRAFKNGNMVCAIASEEEDEFIDLDRPDGPYVVAFDPLDGSSNIDVNVSIGTIFSVYRRKTPVGTKPTKEDVLQTGREQLMGGYVIYGSSTMLVFTAGKGVHGFTYDPSLGEFFLSNPNMQFPQKGTIFSINEGPFNSFSPALQKYVSHCKKQELKARYTGSLVADFHRNLIRGGIYMYPATAAQPQGKLRLLFECQALAYIAEQAGGAASDGNIPIMDLVPTEGIHQRCPFYVGNTDMVNEAITGVGF